MKFQKDDKFVYVLVENDDYENGNYAELFKFDPVLLRSGVYRLPIRELTAALNIPFRPYSRDEYLKSEREFQTFINNLTNG